MTMYPEKVCQTIVIYFLLDSIKFVLSRSFFCNEYPEAWYCKRDAIEYPDEKTCGSPFSSVVGWFTIAEQDQIVSQINDLRAKLAQGSLSLDGTAFPSAGDIVQVKYHHDLAKSAQAHAKTCDTNLSTKKSRIVPNLEDSFIDVLMISGSDTEKIPLEEIIPNAIQKWSNDDLVNIKFYAGPPKKYDAGAHPVIIYNKYPWIGCGKIYFYSEGSEKIWKYYMECLFAAGNLSLSTFYGEDSKSKKSCSTCPALTSCAKSGPYSGILCAYSGSSINQRMNTFRLVATVLITLIIQFGKNYFDYYAF